MEKQLAQTQELYSCHARLSLSQGEIWLFFRRFWALHSGYNLAGSLIMMRILAYLCIFLHNFTNN